MIRYLTPLVFIIFFTCPNLSACSFGVLQKRVSPDSNHQSHSGVAIADVRDRECANAVLPITAEYGSDGSRRVITETFVHPQWPREKVYVFHPANISSPAPVIFFSHAYGATSPKYYAKLIDHIVSRGYVVVYSPYKTLRSSNSQRYALLWSGFAAASAKYGKFMDLTKVGFVGHSFGGGATPAMAYKGLVEKRWGSRAAFIYIMAPWYSFEIRQQQMKRFPKQTNLLVQVYQDDNINDHRMAIDLFKTISVPQKAYMMLQSASSQNCQLPADHFVPLTSGNNGRVNGLDYFGVYRVFDALADYSFNGNQNAKQVVFGNSSDNTVQQATVNSTDGKIVMRLTYSKNPQPIKSEEYYKFPQNQKSRYNSATESGIDSVGNTQGNDIPKRGRRRLFCGLIRSCD
jgi:hypothetical protein